MESEGRRRQNSGPTNRNHIKAKFEGKIAKQKSELENLNNELQEINSQLKDSENTLTLAQQVYEGTYVQSIVRDEKIRNVADFVPLGKTVL